MWNSIIILFVILMASTRLDTPLWDIEEPAMESQIKIVDESYYDSDFEFRLPPFIVPVEYDIFIEMFFDERKENPYSYDGYVFITIKPLAFLHEIILHSVVDIHEIKLFKKGSNDPLQLDRNVPYILEPKYQMLTVNSADIMKPDNLYVLSINFSKTLYDGPMKGGPFKGYYYDEDGIERAYASAYFQPNTARHAFPCFDEPSFKSVFYLHISRPVAYRQTYSNTPIMSVDSLDNNRVRDHFYPTPRVSPYGLTFLVSEKFQVIAENQSFSPAIRVIGAPNAVGLGDHALSLIVDSVQYFNNYFGVPYSSFSRYLMNDHVASPDWASSATENWGLVSYREMYVLLNLSETMMHTEIYSTTLITHELAHQWFGNFITCDWWSNTWLNEGFASYLGFYAADKLYPKYNLNELFNYRYVSKALEYDSGGSANPLYYGKVNTPHQVALHFGAVSYNKAATFLRMTADIVTHETFQKACQILLKSKVHVDHTTGEMKLYQTRYNNPLAKQVYPIPITYSSKSYRNFENVIPTIIMTGKQMSVNKSDEKEWVIFNHLQHGYYRVTYDDTTWGLITEALLYTRYDIHHLNRAQIVDDVFAYMKNGQMTFTRGFEILRFLRYEDNLYVWLVALPGYKWIRDKILHLPRELAEFDSFLLSYLEHAIKIYGFEPAIDETTTVTMARKEILEFACDLGHQRCVEDSVRRFTAWRVKDTWISPQIRRHVYRSGIREGGMEDFEFLLNRFNNSKFLSDRLEMLRGLAVTRHPDLLNRFMDLTVSKAIRPHDKVDVFSFAAGESPALVLEYVKKNIAAIRVGYIEDGPKAPVHMSLGYLASRLNEKELEEYESWAKTVQSIPQYGVIMSNIDIARDILQWGREHADSILEAVRGSAFILTPKFIIFFLAFFTIAL